MVKCSSPKGHKNIRAHFVFDVKHDGIHEARLVSDRNLTDVPLYSVFSVAVSLRGIRIVLFLADLNKLDSWGTGIDNTCLEALTKVKVHFKAGQEFGPLQGHAFLINKALQ